MSNPDTLTLAPATVAGRSRRQPLAAVEDPTPGPVAREGAGALVPSLTVAAVAGYGTLWTVEPLWGFAGIVGGLVILVAGGTIKSLLTRTR